MVLPVYREKPGRRSPSRKCESHYTVKPIVSAITCDVWHLHCGHFPLSPPFHLYTFNWQMHGYWCRMQCNMRPWIGVCSIAQYTAEIFSISSSNRQMQLGRHWFTATCSLSKWVHRILNEHLIALSHVCSIELFQLRMPRERPAKASEITYFAVRQKWTSGSKCAKLRQHNKTMPQQKSGPLTQATTLQDTANRPVVLYFLD